MKPPRHVLSCVGQGLIYVKIPKDHSYDRFRRGRKESGREGHDDVLEI